MNELARLLGLPAEAVDWGLGLVQSLRVVAEAPGYPDASAEAVRRQVEAIAAEAGRMASHLTRSVLSLITLQGRALAVRQQAPALWRVLKRRSPAERRVLVENTQEYRSWGLCELLCAESVKAAADNADRAVELAELAVYIAELAPGEQPWRWRLQGYTIAHLANAWRVRSDLPAAEKAFARAAELWQAGAPGDPGLLCEAQVLSLEASLRIDQCRLDEAAALLDRALAGDPAELRTNLLIQKARLLEWSGEYDAALATLQQLLADRLDTRQQLMLRFNRAWNLCHVGRHEEAEILLWEVKELTTQLDNRLDSLRFRWLEGRIATGLGRSEQALAALSEVRNRFADLGIAYDAALATLELAVLYLQRERTREVKTLARQMAPIFRAQGVHREALAALKLFCEAAEKEAATVQLTRRIVDYLYRAQHNPQLRFEAVG